MPAPVPLFASRVLRDRRTFAWASLAGLAALGTLRALAMVPVSARLPWGLTGPLGGLGLRVPAPVVAAGMVVMTVCYLVLVWAAPAAPRAPAIGLALALLVVFTLVPPHRGHDVFAYVAYGRMTARHLNPYTHGPGTLGPDPVSGYYAPVFSATPTKYGSLFTLLCAALTPLGVIGAAWALKLLTGLAAAALLALVHRAARRAGRDATSAVIFVGLNPLFLAYAVAGAHNDVLMALVLAAGLAPGTRGAVPGVVAAAVKPTAAVAAAVLVVGAGSRRAAVASAAATTAVLGVMSVLVFGSPAPFARALQHYAAGQAHSLPGLLRDAVGLDLLTTGGRTVLLAAFLVVLATILALVWQRRMASATACGWAMVAVLACSTVVFAWYIAWLLPLAAPSPSRRLRASALALTAAFVALSPARRLVGL